MVLIPAAGEDRFKFFHRSFFEYFYSQYIFLRIREVAEVYDSLQKFDVDSEVFELTLAMMKQKDEPRYQELMEYIFGKMEEEVKVKGEILSAFNILTLGMQVVDDQVYICKYIDYISNNSASIVKNIEKIPNQWIILNVISSNHRFIQQVIDAYGANAKVEIIKTFLENFSDMEQVINRKEFKELPEEERGNYFSRRFYRGYWNAFYVRLYIRNVDYSNILSKLSESDLEALLLKCKVPKRTREKYIKLYIKYLALDEKKQRMLQDAILCKPHK